MYVRARILALVAVINLVVLLPENEGARAAGDDTGLNWSRISDVLRTVDSEKFTAKSVASGTETFVPGYRELLNRDQSAESKFTEVKQVSPVSGKCLDVSKDSASPGDFVILDSPSGSKSRRVVLIYAGERAFGDAPKTKLSFFVYPYRTRLEFNTFPPRLHEQLLKGIGLDTPQSSATVVKYSEPDVLFQSSVNGKAGTSKWLQKPTSLGKPPLFYSSAIWNARPSYRILRPKSSESLASVFLKDVREMPCHFQLHPTKEQYNKDLVRFSGGSCFWQCYSDSLAYQTRGKYPEIEKAAVQYEANFVKKYLVGAKPDIESAMRDKWLAAVTPNHPVTGKPLSASEKSASLENKVYWEYWLGLRQTYELMKSELAVKFFAPQSLEECVGVLQSQLAADKPVSAAIVYWNLIEDPGAAPDSSGVFSSPISAVTPTAPVTGGHIVTVIGLSESGGKKYIYFQDGLQTSPGADPGTVVSARTSVRHIRRIEVGLFWGKLLRRPAAIGTSEADSPEVRFDSPPSDGAKYLPPLFVLGKSE